MKTFGYISIVIVALFTYPVRHKVVELPVKKVNYEHITLDSLKQELDCKTNLYESEKIELINLQKEIGIR